MRRTNGGISMGRDAGAQTTIRTRDRDRALHAGGSHHVRDDRRCQPHSGPFVGSIRDRRGISRVRPRHGGGHVERLVARRAAGGADPRHRHHNLYVSHLSDGCGRQPLFHLLHLHPARRGDPLGLASDQPHGHPAHIALPHGGHGDRGPCAGARASSVHRPVGPLGDPVRSRGVVRHQRMAFGGPRPNDRILRRSIAR